MGHKGKLYAAISYWMDPRNPWYGGTDLREGWAQVLRLDAADAAWQVDAQFPRHLRLEILYSASFRTDAEGRALPEPANLLLAATYEGNVQFGMSLFTRDEGTGAWANSKIITGDTGVREEGNSVRAMRVYRDRVTGVDRLFVSVGVHGIMLGIYDPAGLQRQALVGHGLDIPRDAGRRAPGAIALALNRSARRVGGLRRDRHPVG